MITNSIFGEPRFVIFIWLFSNNSQSCSHAKRHRGITNYKGYKAFTFLSIHKFNTHHTIKHWLKIGSNSWYSVLSLPLYVSFSLIHIYLIRGGFCSFAALGRDKNCRSLITPTQWRSYNFALRGTCQTRESRRRRRENSGAVGAYDGGV